MVAYVATKSRQSYTSDVHGWMVQNTLQLNENKTEVFLITTSCSDKELRASSSNSNRVQHCAIRQKCQKPWCHSRFKIIHWRTRQQSVSDGLLGASEDLFNQTVLDRWSSSNPSRIARPVLFRLRQLSACGSTRLSLTQASESSKCFFPLDSRVFPKRTV